MLTWNRGALFLVTLIRLCGAGWGAPSQVVQLVLLYVSGASFQSYIMFAVVTCLGELFGAKGKAALVQCHMQDMLTKRAFKRWQPWFALVSSSQLRQH